MFDKIENEYAQYYEINWPNDINGDENEEEFTIDGNLDNKIFNEDNYEEIYHDKLKNFVKESKKTGISSKENPNSSLNLTKTQKIQKDDSNKSKLMNNLLGRKRKT